MRSRYGWRKWERWCYGFDMPAGQTFSYVDGEHDSWEQQKNADAVFNSLLERANKKIPEADVITDVIVGCFLTEDTAGTLIKCRYPYKMCAFKSYHHEFRLYTNI